MRKEGRQDITKEGSKGGKNGGFYLNYVIYSLIIICVMGLYLKP